jgi:hypothetical protein
MIDSCYCSILSFAGWGILLVHVVQMVAKAERVYATERMGFTRWGVEKCVCESEGLMKCICVLCI